MTSLGDLDPGAPAPDQELIAAAREGDDRATDQLFRRHVEAARRFARTLTEDAAAEDLVSEAFTRLFAALRNGAGPTEAFRPYLLRTVRNLHVSRIRRDRKLTWVEDPVAADLGDEVGDETDERHESELLARAFRSLPERWQTVLWHTAVEGEDHQAVGTRIGLSANAVGALAFRAREGLRRAYLEAHLAEAADERCRSVREQLPAYLRGGVDPRRRGRIEEHLRSCPACTAGMLEIGRINNRLGAALAPALLGLAAGERYLALGSTPTTPISGGGRTRRPAQTLGVAAAAALVVALTAWWVVAAGGDRDESAVATAPVEPVEPDEPDGPVAPVGPDSPDSPTPAPEDAPTTPDAPLAPVEPAAPPSSPAGPTPSEPTEPAEPTEPTEPTDPPEPTEPTEPTDPPEPPREDLLRLTEGYAANFGAHRHVQVRPRSPYDATYVRLTAAGLRSWTVHEEAGYRAVRCERETADSIVCHVGAGDGIVGIDLDLDGPLTLVAEVYAEGVTDPTPGNNRVRLSA